VALVAAFNAWWIWPVLSRPDNWQWGADLLLASCSLADAAIVLALYRSPYYRHMFAEFPSPQNAAPKAIPDTVSQGTSSNGAETNKQQNGT
jgi:hypothetical protein